jgi:3D (Asp-Asp-Asp) domain-containing protein
MIVKLILLGVLQVTSYCPRPQETKPECISRDHCRTSIDDGVTRFGVAVSQDMLKDGRVCYGDVLWIKGYGWRVVNDCMNARYKNSIDLMVMKHSDEKQIGVRHLQVYVADGITTLPGITN